MNTRIILRSLLFVAFCCIGICGQAEEKKPLKIEWEKNYLTISADHLPGPITIHYLEAYCRAGSTSQAWGLTVLKHKAELIEYDADKPLIRLKDTLADGVVVEHTITATHDEVDFRIKAYNPTDKASEAHWAQPCIRVDKFTGTTRDDARELVPAYAKKCFLFLDNTLTRLPTQPWADKAMYIPGQVYCPKGVDRNDVNPRPLSDLVPSHALCGCFSGDEKMVMATAFEPYQEIFQGVIACMHNDFRIGGLKPKETKQIRGKVYLVPSDMPLLVKRFEKDFPEQVK
ncbi:MAG: hypothetical protein ACKVH8_18695 [Pirellulales bacterium]